MDRRSRILTVAVTLIAGGAMLVGCASQRQDRLASTDTREQVLAVAREREAELSTLRAEMAATRIAAAKKEAELVELRALVAQLRQENTDSHQRLLETRQAVEVRQTEMNTLKAERDQLLVTKQDQSLTALKEGLMVLTKQLEDVRQDIGQKSARTSGKALRPSVERTTASSPPVVMSSPVRVHPSHVYEGPSSTSAVSLVAIHATQPPSDVLRIRVQSGDSLSGLARRYHTTVTAIVQLNQLHTDVIAVGQGLLVPSPSSLPSDRER
ncbi:MAG TPA: LysM peptidoglycan-binding domain-containing protein [Nitrospira sp.]|nr:LysM peptidoglycan-binding domain-containing protein [Nitrospira sp.]HMU31903.1 LysM peptidoglycan-binding domain-containing protein [Nitrospira sp.]HMX93511.1 LysM peptidoglycan-binding domain-containing protein [Nitrospira sp.]HNG55513.1 LysM peptidoglycan-binding domain-containing protein [Nitrospira sp.]